MARRIKSTKIKKRGKHFSWHFWFLHTLTILALLMGYLTGIANDQPVTTMLAFGALVYISPLFLHLVRNMMPRALMLKFYLKCI